MATIQDVAKHAGVSIATVSRVLNGTTYVNEEVTSRVRAAIKELNYQPSRAAQALRAHRSKIIGLLISDIQNPFFTGLIRGVEDVANRNGYSLILCNSDENPRKEQQYIEVLCSERVAGAIVVSTSENPKKLHLFRDHDIPFVSVDRRIKDRTTDAILIDNVSGAYEAVTHLITNGYHRIGVITGPVSTTTGRERLEGYRKALREAGLALEPALECVDDFKSMGGYQGALKLLDLTPPIDALFVTNNLMTLGALEAIHERHLRIPDDIAIVGFDEMPWAALSAISLTTVTQPVYELGSSAALRLFQRLQNPTSLSKQEIVLSPTLQVRDSTRPRPSLKGA
ncbi:LacI family transcriptional regulator [Dictyobacter sp. S3.2.2.5]|uniref:LacI family transcriptional regulator n=1 Tax=Dictyobacter halimunensis TaxID=3026934 RepID=A0ABQ6FH81_9CHLR|nr:LacI family transcriptional regulator [Dictyobacter sp. S3.2.2.5]